MVKEKESPNTVAIDPTGPIEDETEGSIFIGSAGVAEVPAVEKPAQAKSEKKGKAKAKAEDADDDTEQEDDDVWAIIPLNHAASYAEKDKRFVKAFIGDVECGPYETGKPVKVNKAFVEAYPQFIWGN